MPSLGPDMEAGTLVEWLVKPGDWVKRGDVVAVVDTQKGAIEVEIYQAGQIEQILVNLDTKVPVGTPLARLRAEGEAMPAVCSSAATAQCDAPAAVRSTPAVPSACRAPTARSSHFPPPQAACARRPLHGGLPRRGALISPR